MVSSGSLAFLWCAHDVVEVIKIITRGCVSLALVLTLHRSPLSLILEGRRKFPACGVIARWKPKGRVLCNNVVIDNSSTTVSTSIYSSSQVLPYDIRRNTWDVCVCVLYRYTRYALLHGTRAVCVHFSVGGSIRLLVL